jgi:hypothetical protein
MRFHTFSALCGLVTCVVISSPASAQPHQGMECMPHNGADIGNIGYDGWGVHSGTSSAQLVHCPGFTGGTGVWAPLSATVYDRSTTDDVRCTITLTDHTGAAMFSTAMSSSGFGSAAQVLGAVVPGVVGAYVVMDCSLPAPTANGFSYLTTYSTP